MPTIATTTPASMLTRERLTARHAKVRHLLRALRDRADAHLRDGREVPQDLRGMLDAYEHERLLVEQRIEDAYL